MENLITTLTESINFKLQEVQELTKMINLVVTKDIKAIRKFIHDHDTFERESFYSYLNHYDKELFAKVYPHAHKDKQIGMYVIGVISKQFEIDKEEEEKWGIDFENGYPDDWCEEQYPDHIDEPDPIKAMAM